MVKSAIPATNLQAVRAKLNQDAHIVGTITKVYTPASHARVLLNFARNYKGAVVGLVDARNFSQFPDLSQLAGKRVVLSGHIIAYKDEIEIALDTSNSIRVVK